MSEEVALAAADLETVAQLRRALDVAMQENDGWREINRMLQQSNHDAWMLVGRLDYFLQTMDGQTVAARQRMAKKLRGEIEATTSMKATHNETLPPAAHSAPDVHAADRLH